MPPGRGTRPIGQLERNLVHHIFIDAVRKIPTMPYMHTVSELKSFRRAAEKAGMSEQDIDGLVEYLAENPEAGDEIAGTGGCRKVRFAIEGNNKGKSGGVRTITLFSGEAMPVFLITVFAKSQQVTLSQAERNQLKTLADTLTQEYSTRVQQIARGATA